ELLAAAGQPEVVEAEGDPVRRDRLDVHPDGDLVEGEQLGEVVAAAPHGRQGEAVRDLVEQLRHEGVEEELAAPALPAQVVHVVDVADDVRLLERDDVAVLVHRDVVMAVPARHDPVLSSSTAITTGSGAGCTRQESVASSSSPELRTTHP